MSVHHLHGRGWIAALAMVLLIVAHAVLFGVATRLHYSVLLAAGLIGIVVLKYGWRKLRRSRAA